MTGEICAFCNQDTSLARSETNVVESCLDCGLILTVPETWLAPSARGDSIGGAGLDTSPIRADPLLHDFETATGSDGTVSEARAYVAATYSNHGRTAAGAQRPSPIDGGAPESVYVQTGHSLYSQSPRHLAAHMIASATITAASLILSKEFVAAS